MMMIDRIQGVLLPRRRRSMNKTPSNNPITTLRKAPQTPLSNRGATPDSDRAKKPPLAEPPATAGELGTVERANEDTAIVKWDDDGRMKIRQPWLKKV